MDIQVASNFERYLFYKLGRDSAALCGKMAELDRTGSLSVPLDEKGAVDERFIAGAANREQVLETIGHFHRDYDYLLDPHTAVGVSVAMRALAENSPACNAPVRAKLHPYGPRRLGALQDAPVICLATAHPAKFPDAIRLATGKDLARHPAIDALEGLPTRCQTLPNDPAAVQTFIEKIAAVRRP